MTWGYGAMGATPFLGLAVLVVMAASFLLPVAYPIGNRRGRRAAIAWATSVLAGMTVAVGVLLSWGISTNQMMLFTASFGTSALWEMTVFCLLWLLIFGFPTLRFIIDMKG